MTTTITANETMKTIMTSDSKTVTPERDHTDPTVTSERPYTDPTAGFVAWWTDYGRRSNQCETLAATLAEILPALGMRKATNFLSVGPASARIEEILVHETLTCVERSYVVEPCPNFMNNFLSLMDRAGVQVTPYRQLIQDFEGTPEKVDLILMTHVAYYFHREFRQQAKKLLNQLAPGGVLVFATKDDCPENKELVNLLPDGNHSSEFCLLPSVAKFRRDLQALDCNIREFVVEHTLDIADTTWGDSSFVSLLLNRPVLKHEIESMCKKAQRRCPPGSKKLILKDRLFIVTK